MIKDQPTRRLFLQLTGAGALASVVPSLAACAGGAQTPPAPPPGPGPVASTTAAAAGAPCVAVEDAGAAKVAPPLASATVNAKKLRIISVPTAVDGNLLPTLVAEFQKTSGLEVTMEATEEPYELAREGKADIVVSHYGHKHLEDFVLEGFAEWPRTIFSNQMAIVGPSNDPAKIRGLADAVEAFKRIAAKKQPFVLNASDGGRYLADILWNAAGRPDKAGWFIDDGLKAEESIRFVEKKHAYSMWGLTPFVRTDKEKHIDLEPLVLADPILQRILVCVVVKDTKLPGTNTAAAKALQTYLLSPVTQAKIRDVRYPGAARAVWTPAGRHNRGNFLPKE